MMRIMSEIVVDLYLNGYKPTKICEILSISRSNVYYILKGGYE